ncbi:MAG: hypothetical protein DME11_09490 [Candidatus Rokuibacteriota bacterium]|nr:MAG: hypothetical protein DME11_09490 [Candidatus Rokubacteria bacterium]
MYLTFYGLAEKPFNATPDPRFLYLSPAHREALAQLLYGVRERKGFIVLTGHVGTGKTTLLHALRQRLDGQTAVSFVVHSTLPFDGILEYVLEDLGIAKGGESRARRLIALNNFLIERERTGQNTVLILGRSAEPGPRDAGTDPTALELRDPDDQAPADPAGGAAGAQGQAPASRTRAAHATDRAALPDPAADAARDPRVHPNPTAHCGRA